MILKAMISTCTILAIIQDIELACPEGIMDDILVGLGALGSPNAGPLPGVGYDATAYPNTSSYSGGVFKGLIDGHKDAKKK